MKRQPGVNISRVDVTKPLLRPNVADE